MSDTNSTPPSGESVKSDAFVTSINAGSRGVSRTRRTSKGSKATPKGPLAVLKFTKEERDPDPEAVLIALRYQFEAIDHILGSNPGDSHFECMASYLALAGVAVVRSLEKRMEESGS